QVYLARATRTEGPSVSVLFLGRCCRRKENRHQALMAYSASCQTASRPFPLQLRSPPLLPLLTFVPKSCYGAAMQLEPPPPTEVPVDLADALGADAGVAVQCFTVYIPNKDKNDQEIGTQRRWVLDAIRLLSEINGGATAIPVEGGWLNEEGKIILEHPVVVYSFVSRPDEFVKHLPPPPRVPAPVGPGDQPGRGRLRVRRPLLPHPPVRPRVR